MLIDDPVSSLLLLLNFKIVGLLSIVFSIILAISRRSSIFRAAVCGYFCVSITLMYMVPHISSLLTVLSNAIEHKVKVDQCCLSLPLKCTDRTCSISIDYEPKFDSTVIAT